MEDQMEVRLKSLLTEVRDVLQVLSGRRESAPLRAVEPRANPEAGREGWSKVRAQLNLGRFTKVADMQQRWAEAHAVQPQTACKELVPDIVAHEREDAASNDGQGTACRFVLEPGTPRLTVWDAVVWCVSMLYVTYVPWALGFETYNSSMEALEPLFEFILLADIAVRFSTAVRWRGLVVRSRSFIAFTYATSWLVLDVVAALPLGFALNKLLRVIHCLVALLRPSYHWNPGLALLAKLTVLLLLAWHWIACAFWSISQAGHPDDMEAWVPGAADFTSGSWHEKYARSFFFGVSACTGVGMDIVPVTVGQTAFTSTVIVFGLVFFALLVGSASSAVAAFNQTAALRRERLEKVNAYLRHHGVRRELQDQINTFLVYVWASETDESLLHNVEDLVTLPPALKAELALDVHRELIHDVPMFSGLPRDTLYALVQCLQRRMYLPEEIIIAEGSTGDSLYVLCRGSVAVEREGIGRVGILSDGAFFGEIALLSPVPIARTASCIAISYCDVVAITRPDFDRVAAVHPGLKDKMLSTQQGHEAGERAKHAHAHAAKLFVSHTRHAVAIGASRGNGARGVVPERLAHGAAAEALRGSPQQTAARCVMTKSQQSDDDSSSALEGNSSQQSEAEV